MSRPLLRGSGQYATLDGREYPCTVRANGVVTLKWEGGDPPYGFSDGEADEVWLRRVSPEDLERLDVVSVLCRWREHRFRVVAVDGDTVVVDYLDDDFTWAGSKVLEQVDRGVWIARLPAVELTEVQEQRTDLLPRTRSEYLDGGSPLSAR